MSWSDPLRVFKVVLLASFALTLLAKKDYFPPPDSRGGWRRLVPLGADPASAQKTRLRKVAGIDWDKLKTAWDYNAASAGRTGLLVIRRGWIVGEWYRDCDQVTKFNIHSSAKSYVSAAYGLLLDERKAKDKGLSLDSKIYTEEWLPEGLPPSDPRKAAITLRHLLTMTSGIASHVDVGEPPAGVGPYEFALGKDPTYLTAKLKDNPGRTWIYSNPSVSHLVMVHRKASGEDLLAFLQRRLFEPIGMSHYDWLEMGGHGGLGPYRQGFSGLLTTPRDHSRFLYLALQHGRWGNHQVVPAEYYTWALAPTPVKPDYGALWWRARIPGTPGDTFQTGGARNNHGWVIPSLDLIVVRFGDGEKYPQDFSAELLRRIQAAIVQKAPVP